MLSTVLRIYRSCPKLIQVNIRWAKEKCLNHLKQEGVYDVVEWEEDGNGMRRPKTLMVFERGIPLIGKPFSRRYKYTLPGSSGGAGRRVLLLRGGGESRWRLTRRKAIVSNVLSGGDTDEGVPVAATVDAVDESETEVEAEPEVEAERDSEVEELEGETSTKGREVKRIGLPTTN